MKKRIVLYKRLSDDLMARLQERVEVTWVDTSQRDGLARLRDALPGAHGLLGASLRLDASLLDLAPQLEVVSSVSVGVDNYDIAELSRRGVMLTNTPDVLTETTADTGFALILATARRVVELANRVIRQIAEQEKFDIIFQDAVFASPRIDITDKVIKALDSGKPPAK